jgi:hypothetical protein
MGFREQAHDVRMRAVKTEEGSDQEFSCIERTKSRKLLSSCWNVH